MKLMTHHISYSGKFKVPVSERTLEQKAAFRQFQRMRRFLSVKDKQLYCRNKIVVKLEDVKKLVQKEYKEKKSIGCRNIFKILKKDYSGISERSIYSQQQSQSIHQRIFPRFQNTPIPVPIIESNVNDRWQMDLVDMKNDIVKYHGKAYRLVITEYFSHNHKHYFS